MIIFLLFKYFSSLFKRVNCMGFKASTLSQ